MAMYEGTNDKWLCMKVLIVQNFKTNNKY